MDEFLKTLLNKEKELRLKLERTPLFIQWQGVKTTIGIFEGETTQPDEMLAAQKNGKHPPVDEKYNVAVPEAYSDDLTWIQKVLFCLSENKEASVADMVKYFIKKGEAMDEDALNKRVGVTASKLHTGHRIKARLIGRKGMYSL